MVFVVFFKINLLILKMKQKYQWFDLNQRYVRTKFYGNIRVPVLQQRLTMIMHFTQIQNEFKSSEENNNNDQINAA